MEKYGKYKNKTYSLRMDNTVREKMSKIAAKENRTLREQIEYICKQYIEKYESENGEIKL